MMPDPNPFSSAVIAQTIHASLDGALSTIPPDHTGAFVESFDVLPTGELIGRIVAAEKINDDWAFGAYGQWSSITGGGAGFAIRGSWGKPKIPVGSTGE